MVYLAWRLYVILGDVAIVRGSLEVSNILLTPPWSFQSISGILNSLTGLAGLNYDFGSEGGALPLTELAGPVLALVFLGAIAWQISKGKAGPGLWAAFAIALTLFISQVLVWIPEIREPATSRYLYPGAFAVLLILIEAFRSQPINRNAFLAIWLVAFCGLATNAALLYREGNSLRDRSAVAKSEVSASVLVASAFPYIPGPDAIPLGELVTDPLISLVAGAETRYGGIGLSEGELLEQSPQNRAIADRVMSGAFGLGLFPYVGPSSDACFEVKADPAGGTGVETVLPVGGATLQSKSAGEVRLRRFDPVFSTSVGKIMPNRKMSLYIPPDDGRTPWQLQADVASLTVCGRD